MKFLMIVLSVALFSGQAIACTANDSNAQSKLIRMFQLNGGPVDWVSVRVKTLNSGKKNIQLDRSFPVTVYAFSRINSSRIVYKRDNYDLKNAKICMSGKSVLIAHPKGELLVRRSGKSLNTSEIRLMQNGGLFTLKLRPKQLLGSKRSIVL